MLPLGEGEKNEEKSLMSSVAEVVERLGYECVHVGVKTDSVRLRLQILIDSMGGDQRPGLRDGVPRRESPSRREGLHGAQRTVLP